jgi:hypothetical protein
MDATEIHIYDEDGKGPDGGEPLVFDLADVDLSTGETLTLKWDEHGVITFDG